MRDFFLVATYNQEDDVESQSDRTMRRFLSISRRRNDMRWKGGAERSHRWKQQRWGHSTEYTLRSLFALYAQRKQPPVAEIEPPQQRTRPEHRSDDADDLDVRVRLSSVHPHERAAQAVPRGGETYPE